MDVMSMDWVVIDSVNDGSTDQCLAVTSAQGDQSFIETWMDISALIFI